MASSSTRSTQLEKDLVQLFKGTHYRLTHASALEERDFVNDQFATLLDCSLAELKANLTPKQDTRYEIAEYTREIAFMKWLKEEMDKKSRGANVWDAGRQPAYVGAELYTVGRDVEARSWCEWGEYLEEMGTRILVQERQWAKDQGFEVED